MLRASRAGSTLPSGCGTTGESKARTTCTSASAGRRLPRKVLSFSSSASTPGRSTYWAVAGVVLCGWYSAASRSSRGSGMWATPWTTSWRPDGWAGPCPRVRMLKMVLFPVYFRPTMADFMSGSAK